MRFRTTLILLAVFLVLLASVLIFESKVKKAAAEKEKAGKLVDIASGDIHKVSLKKGEIILTFEKDDKGDWLMTAPLQAKADTYEVDSLIRSFADLAFDRVVEETSADISVYEIPQRELTLWAKGRTEPVKVLFGMENPLDQSLFAKREDESRVVLLSSSLKTALDKTDFDFRKKDIFGFEKDSVKSIKLKAGDVRWEAVREEDDWLFTSPVRALAGRTKLDGLLDSLSGLRAKEFVSEDKSDGDVRTYGLEKPEYEIVLSMPAESRDVVFSLHKAEDKFYAMASDSNKIVLFEGSLLDDLERNVTDLREKRVSEFYSWEADRIRLLKGDFSLTAVKEKVDDVDKWLLDTPAKEEADGSKVEAFIRKVEGLDAVEFVDSPGSLAPFGLDPPEVEIRIRTKGSGEEASEAVILVGTTDKEAGYVFVKNAKFDYLFRVDASFLEDFPKEAKVWQVSPPEDDPARKKDDKG